MIQLKNKYLQAQINLLGAEVKSVKNILTDHEYMWSGDDSVWAGVSPVLFPAVGKSIDNQIKHNGKSYPMGNHGFARHSVFDVIKQSDSGVILSITTTTENYPFKLQFNVSYQLDAKKLITTYQIINLDNTIAHCGFGAHPAFACPFDSHHDYNDYELVFGEEENLSFHPITPEAFYTGEVKNQTLSKISLDNHTFDDDALVYSGFSSKKVRLTEKGSNRYIQVEFDGFEYLGLWSKPKARYVCIEPWCGRSDTLGFDGDIDQRIGNVSIDGFSSVVKSYTIEFGC